MSKVSPALPSYEVRWHFDVYLWEMSDAGHGWIATDCSAEFGGSQDMVRMDEEFEAWGQVYLKYEAAHDTGGEFADMSGFDWDSFNAKGVELAKNLKGLLGLQRHVQYSKSIHDPDRHALVWSSPAGKRAD